MHGIKLYILEIIFLAVKYGIMPNEGRNIL